MTRRDVSSWLPNLLGADTVLVGGNPISVRRNSIDFPNATFEDDPESDATRITLVESPLSGLPRLTNGSSGTLNNVSAEISPGVGAKTLMFASGSPVTVTGISPVIGPSITFGRRLSIVSLSAAVTLKNQNNGSTLNYRIITGTGGDLTIPAGASLDLAYEGTNSFDGRWRVVGGTGGGGATPGGSDGQPQIKLGSALAGVPWAVPSEAFSGADDAAKLTAALASIPTYGALELGAKTYEVATHIVPIGAQIRGQGDKTILSTTSNGTLLRLDVGAEDVNISDLKLLGSATGASQHGIECGRESIAGTGIGRARFTNITIESFGGRGITLSRAAASLVLYYGPQISNFRIRSCGIGILDTESAEYIKATNGDIRNCTVGMQIGAGNFSGHAINITACTTGVKLTPGANDAHGQLVGCNINHNTVAIDIGAISQPFTFSGCNVYEGNIIANGNVRVVQFEGGEIDFTSLVNTNGKLRFVGCVLVGDYFASCSESGTGWTEFVNCRGANGALPAYAASRINRVFTFAADANQTLTWQESVAESLLVTTTGITAARTLTSQWGPNDGRTQRVTNYNAQSVAFKWSTGTSVTIASGTWALIGSDGSNAMVIAAGTVTGTGPAPIAGAYDPAIETLTVWARASYAGAPWAGTASAGGSGSVPLATGGTAPAVGTPLNGFTPADFNGTTQSVIYNGAPLNGLLAATGYSYSLLVFPRGGAAPAGIVYDNQQLVADGGAVFGLAWSTSGVKAWHDATGIKQTAWVPCSANAWHWIDVKYDGTNLMVRVDGGAWASIASGNPGAAGWTGAFLRIGRNWNATTPVYTSELIAELMMASSAVSDATLSNRRTSYGNSRYGLSL